MVQDIKERELLDILKVDDAIRRTIKNAERDFTRGGHGYAKEFFTIPCKARRKLDDRGNIKLGRTIDTAISSTPYVHHGYSHVWSLPGLFFPGKYSITIYINT